MVEGRLQKWLVIDFANVDVRGEFVGNKRKRDYGQTQNMARIES
jgi:hypothetical protein